MTTPATMTPERATRLAVQGICLLMQGDGSTDIGNVTRLLELGADPNGRRKSDGRPLLQLLFEDRIDWPVGPSVLASAAHNPNAIDEKSGANRSLRLNLLRALLNAGADVKLVDEQGLSALHLACSACDASCIALLLDAGADANLLSAVSSEVNGRPLHRVIRSLFGSPVHTPPIEEVVAVFSTLAAHGADWSLDDKKHQRPAQLLPAHDDVAGLSDGAVASAQIRCRYRAEVKVHEDALLLGRAVASASTFLFLAAARRGAQGVPDCGPRGLGLLSPECLRSIVAFSCPDKGLLQGLLLAWDECREIENLKEKIEADELRLLAASSDSVLDRKELPGDLLFEMDERTQAAFGQMWARPKTKSGQQAKAQLLQCAERVSALLVACGFKNGSDSDSDLACDSE